MNTASKHLVFKFLFGIILTGLLLLLGIGLSGAANVRAEQAGDETPAGSHDRAGTASAGFQWEYQIDFSMGAENNALEKYQRVEADLVTAGMHTNLEALDGSQYRLTVSGDRDLDQIRRALYAILLPQFNLFQEPWLIEILFPETTAVPVTLKLESLPSTGFTWRLNNPELSGFQLVGTPESVDRYEMPGTPALQMLQFESIASGPATLELIYRRPFGEVKPPSRHLTIRLDSAASMIDLSDPNPPQMSSAAAPEQELNSRSAPDSLTTPAAALPASYDWRTYNKVSPIRDQDGCGSCWAFGTTAVMESALNIYNGMAADLSEQFLVSCNLANKNRQCGNKYSCSYGGCEDAQDYHTYESGEAQTAIGAVLEADFPYTATDAACPAGLNHPYRAADWYFVGGSNPTVDQIKNVIYTYGPVTTRVCAMGGFYSYTGGVFTEDNRCSNHLVALVGWDDATQTWILRNSWGTGWGEAGYMHIRWGVSSVGLLPSFATYQHLIYGKTSPANFSYNQPASLNLTWEANTGTTNYEYCVDTTDNGTCDEGWINNGTSTTASLSGLSAGTRYFWHVRANTPAEYIYSNYSENAWWSFRTAGCSGGLCVEVTDAAGNPISGANVYAFTNLSAYSSSWDYTDDTGYAGLNVSPGSYSLVVSSYSNNFVVVKNVTAPGSVIVNPTGTVQVTVNAKILGGATMANAGISAIPALHGSGYIGRTNASGSFTGWVTPGLTYAFTAWGWDDLYYLGMPGVNVPGLTTVNLFADNMSTGKLQVNLDNFTNGYFVPWSEIAPNSTASYNFASGATFTLSALYYDIGLNPTISDASGNWEYGFNKSITIANGDNLVWTFGGNLTLTTQTDQPSYLAGDSVNITNTFTDAYGNRLSSIYNYTGASGPSREPVQTIHSDSKGEDPGRSPGFNPQAWNYIYPRLLVTDPNSGSIFDNQSWNNWNSNSFVLPVPGVMGIHTVNLSLETGPYKGLVGTTGTFTIAPSHTISGFVHTATGTGLGNARMSGLPHVVFTDANGYYIDQVADGWSGTVTPQRLNYSFNPASLPYSNVTGDWLNQNYTGSHQPSGHTLLLVDDDDNIPDVRSYYSDALAALGKSYDLWDTANSDREPDAVDLSHYDAVIWFTGDEFGGFAGPGPAGESALGAWLNGGGCFLLSSQDYIYDRGLTSFASTYLGTSAFTSDVGQNTVTGTGSVFSGLGPYTLSYPFTNFSDRLTAGAEAEGAFNGDKGIAAVDKNNGTYRTAFLGFPMEALPSAAARQSSLSTFLTWCSSIPFPPRGVNATDGTYLDRVRVSWNAPAGATYYEIYRSSTNSASTVTLLGSAAASPYDDSTGNPGTVYWYYVKACSIHGCSALSASDRGNRAWPGPVKKIYLPMVQRAWDPTLPTLIKPPDGAQLDTLIPEYEFYAGIQPPNTGGALDFSTDPDPNLKDWWSSFGLQSFAHWKIRSWFNLQPSTTYYWRVGVVPNFDYSQPFRWTQHYRFTTAPGGGTIPSVPSLVSPLSGAVVPANNVLLQWNAVPGAVEYAISVHDMDRNWYWSFNTSATQINISSYALILAGNHYEWYVSARNDYAWSDDSVTWNFSVSAASSGFRTPERIEEHFILRPDGVKQILP